LEEALDRQQRADPRCCSLMNIDKTNRMSIDLDRIELRNNPDRNRFEADVDGTLAVAEYIQRQNFIIFTHTEVPPTLEGQGIGSRLARFALEYAREQGWQVNLLCPYIAAYIRRHPEFRDILKPGIKV